MRIALAEKAIDYEAVEIDLSKPARLGLRAERLGKVPVLDDGFVLPESEVIMEYLEERTLEPPLLPADAARGRPRARLSVFRFDELLGDDYYAFRRGEQRLGGGLDALPVGSRSLRRLRLRPWVMRAREMLAVVLPERLSDWLEGLLARPSVAAELEPSGGSPIRDRARRAGDAARRRPLSSTFGRRVSSTGRWG